MQIGAIPDSTAGAMDQTSQPVSSPASTRMRLAAFGVHIFTAIGAGIALIAMLEAVREHWANVVECTATSNAPDEQVAKLTGAKSCLNLRATRK